MLPDRATLTAITTLSTCGHACWHALEEVCRCSCGGRNHGILKHGGEQPARTCRVQGQWYTIHSITNYKDGHALCLRLREEAKDTCPYTGLVYYDSKPGDAYYLKSISESQRKWPEVQAIPNASHIIWKKGM